MKVVLFLLLDFFFIAAANVSPLELDSGDSEIETETFGREARIGPYQDQEFYSEPPANQVYRTQNKRPFGNRRRLRQRTRQRDDNGDSWQTDVNRIPLSDHDFATAEILDTYAEAEIAVNAMKKNWGTGVSTRVIIHNDTPETLKHFDHKSWAGYFVTGPPSKIPPGKYAVFFHAKKFGVWGSMGAAVFAAPDLLFAIGWDSPFGSNKWKYIGVDLEDDEPAHADHLVKHLEGVITRHRGSKGKARSHFGKYKATAEFKVYESTTTVLYTLKESTRSL